MSRDTCADGIGITLFELLALAFVVNPIAARGVLPMQLPKELQLDDSLRRIRECSHEVWAVKLADRITNLQAPPARWGADKRRIYREEARRIHTALANAHGVLAARLAERIEAYAAYL